MDDADNVERIATVLRQFWAELIKNTPGAMLQLMRRADLSLPQLVALLYVHRRPSATISEISEHLNLSLGATSHLVDRLVVCGLVARVEALADRRQKQINLTPAGHAFVEEAQRARVDHLARALTKLPGPLLDQLLSDLTAAMEQLRALEPDAVERER